MTIRVTLGHTNNPAEWSNPKLTKIKFLDRASRATIVVFMSFLLSLPAVYADAIEPVKGRIMKSFVSEDASYNGFALSAGDIVNVKNKKDVFTLGDEKITWSACIRGGLMSHNEADYAVLWYAPDGILFERQAPKPLFVDCAGLKTSLPIDKEKFAAKTGLWKIEVTYKDSPIDDKYFYLLETGAKEIAPEEVNSLEALIAKNKPQPKVEAPAVVQKPVEIPVEQSVPPPAPVIQETPKDIAVSYDIKDSAKETKKLSENLQKLEKEIIDETKKAEDLFYKTGALYEDEIVVPYINGIAKKLSAKESFDQNTHLQIKIIREPTVNAFAMATGSIYIHTGALARLENEDQLAHLLGHEISHVTNKDMVYFMNSYHKKTIVYKLFDIVLAPTSVFFGVLGDLTQTAFLLFHVATVTGYSRINEARADKEGMAWATEQRYNPQAGPGLMQVFLSEGDRYQTGPEIFFLMMHPTTKWRINELKKIVSENGPVQQDAKVDEEFLRSMTRIKLYNATLNIRWDRLEHARDNIQWVLEKDPNNAEAHYLAGEIWRLKSEDSNKVKDELNYKKWSEMSKGHKKAELEDMWYKKALEEYNQAITCNSAYANSYKGLALAYKYKNDKENALVNLNKYLEADPNAPDRRYVNNLIERLKKPEEKKK